MKILLDTHIAIWMLKNKEDFPRNVAEIILDENNEVYFSVASIWEVDIKHNKHPEKVPVDGRELFEMCLESGLEELKISSEHAVATSGLKIKNEEFVNGDPFDRIMLAQAKVESMKFITHDSVMKHYDEECIMLV